MDVFAASTEGKGRVGCVGFMGLRARVRRVEGEVVLGLGRGGCGAGRRGRVYWGAVSCGCGGVCIFICICIYTCAWGRREGSDIQHLGRDSVAHLQCGPRRALQGAHRGQRERTCRRAVRTCCFRVVLVFWCFVLLLSRCHA